MAKRTSSQANLLPKRKRRQVTNKPPSRTRSGARRSTTSLAVQHGEDNATEHIGSIQPPLQVATADTLIPIDVKVHWVRNRGNIDDTLQTAIENGIDIPDHNMDFTHDPRLLESIFAFKDIIKRMYKCQEISMDIQSLRLKHDSPDGEIETDILTRPWEKTLEIFNDRNLAYYVSVVFEPVDDVEANLWESLVPQPELHSFFDVQESGLSLNTTQILERTVELPEYQDFLDETEDDQAVDEIGTAPEPKAFDSKEAQIQHYGGYDVSTEDGRRRWQNRLLANLSCNGKAARVKLNKLPVELNNSQKASVTMVQEQMHRIAIEKEACTNTTKRPVSESEYCVLQRAFSGTDYRSGPPVDLCLRLLLATKQDNGLYRSELLEEFVDSDFYHYQISGAVGIIAKLYGQIDANKLLLATDCLQHPQAGMVRDAAAQLKDFCLHGAILADETGFGKTKQSLLAAVLHTFLYTEKDEDGNDCHRPILLVVPPTLIRQWLVEIRDHWPHLIPVLSYHDTAFRMDMDLSTLSYQAMREVPELTAIPERLKYIFDMRDEDARQVIIITSYATHRFRAGHSEEHHVPPVRHDPPQYNPETKQEIYKVRSRLQLIWSSPHKGKYSLLIADEAQKVKNPETYTWQVLRVHEMPKTLLMTATPMFNAALDLVGLVGLLWPAANKTLQSWLEAHPEEAERHKKLINIDSDDISSRLPGIDPLNPIRIEIMNACSLEKMFDRDGRIHLRVAARFREVLDMVTIQRSQGSTLPNLSGEPICLKSLFKKINYKSASIGFPPSEELEYQLWHKTAADEYITEMKEMRGGSHSGMAAPGKPVVKQARRRFFTAVRPLRKLGIAVFALKMARLNAVMETVGGDTHFKTIRSWRNNGLGSDFIHALTRGEGEPPPHNAESLISHLTRGSPVVRLVFQEILTVKAVERVNKAAFGHHQKLIVGEIVPANAFYLEQVLRACLIDARVFHANLSNHAKTAMVELFNDPNSTLKVLIMLYEVGAVGLNLHKACNRVVIASIPRGRAQESQLAGRALRITSEFPLTVVRRVTPDSHDAFRGSKQAEKAALQLAANARDPSIKELLVELLNEFQKEVNLYHSQAKPRGLELAPPKDPPVSPFANQDTPSPEKKPEATIIPPEERKLRDRTQITRPGKSPYMEDSTEEDEEDNALFVKQDDPDYLDAGEYPDEEDVSFDDEFSVSDIFSEDDSDAEHENKLRNLDTSQFMNQPDDFTRHKNTLLKHPAGKIWNMKDLDDEKFLKLALRLLYNKMNGIELLHLDKSIHICYKQFSKKLRFRAEKAKTPTMENQEMAKEKGL